MNNIEKAICIYAVSSFILRRVLVFSENSKTKYLRIVLEGRLYGDMLLALHRALHFTCWAIWGEYVSDVSNELLILVRLIMSKNFSSKLKNVLQSYGTFKSPHTAPTKKVSLAKQLPLSITQSRPNFNSK